MQAKNPGGGTLLNAANQLVPGIVEACEKYSVLDQRLRLELIEFHSVAEVVIPLSAIDAFSDNIPQLVAKGGTNFAAATKDSSKAVECLREILNTLVNSIVSLSAGDNPTGRIVVDPEMFDSNEWDFDEFV